MNFKSGIILTAIGAVSSCAIVNAAYVDVTVADPHRDKKFVGGVAGDLAPTLPEDGRVEWNAIANQSWDLESFKFDAGAKKLEMSGGFNFATGQGYNGDGLVGSINSTVLPMGDIFIYIDTGVPYTTPNALDNPVDHDGPWAGANEWDYVVAFKRNAAGNIITTGGVVQYDIKPNTGAATLTGGTSTLNSGLPWKYNADVTGSLSATYTTYNGVAQTASNANQWFNTITGIDLSSIDLGTKAFLHTTMKCGNDVMWGKVPDSGTTLVLLGVGMLGLGALRRRSS